jgi:hypothetical protein
MGWRPGGLGVEQQKTQTNSARACHGSSSSKQQLSESLLLHCSAELLVGGSLPAAASLPSRPRRLSTQPPQSQVNTCTIFDRHQRRLLAAAAFTYAGVSKGPRACIDGGGGPSSRGTPTLFLTCLLRAASLHSITNTTRVRGIATTSPAGQAYHHHGLATQRGYPTSRPPPWSPARLAPTRRLSTMCKCAPQQHAQ